MYANVFNDWTSLETVQVIVSILTPILGFFIAWKLSKIGKDLESKQWGTRKVIEKRLEFYDLVVPKLNDLLCFYNRFGNWKEMNPENVIKIKRVLDKKFHVYEYIFKEDVLSTYTSFMDNCFITNTGTGENAKIKSNFVKRESQSNWEDDWKSLFAPSETVPLKDFNKNYKLLLQQIRKELEL